MLLAGEGLAKLYGRENRPFDIGNVASGFSEFFLDVPAQLPVVNLGRFLDRGQILVEGLNRFGLIGRQFREECRHAI